MYVCLCLRFLLLSGCGLPLLLAGLGAGVCLPPTGKGPALHIPKYNR